MLDSLTFGVHRSSESYRTVTCMSFPFTHVKYADLNARQKESFNSQKVSAVLADYGFVTILLSDDWNGADFLALRHTGETLKVQLKARMNFDAKYEGKDLWLCFPDDGAWYLGRHDELKKVVFDHHDGPSASWPSLPTKLREVLAPYRLQPPA